MFPIRHPLVLACAAACFGLGLLLPAARSFGAQGLPEAAAAARPKVTGDVEALAHLQPGAADARNALLRRAAERVEVTYGALRGLLKPLDDPFTRFMDPAEYKSQRDETVGDFVGIGVYLNPKPTRSGYYSVERTLPGGPAAGAGLRTGNVILTVDGRSVKGARARAGFEGDPRQAGDDRPAKRLPPRRQTPGGAARAAEDRRVPGRRALDEAGNLGYVRLSLFNAHADEQVRKAIQALGKAGMKGLILDLRDNPVGCSRRRSTSPAASYRRGTTRW